MRDLGWMTAKKLSETKAPERESKTTISGLATARDW
jgi:hypothetical protein